jgi:uncharacterized protein YggE
MKRIIFLMVVLFALPSIAQEHVNTITVTGETEKIVEESGYTILVALQQILVFEGQGEVEVSSVEDVKKNYIDKLNEVGIDFNQFYRNTYYEFAASYSATRETQYYYFQTPNKEDVRKILNVKLAGISIADTVINGGKLTNEELASLTKKAIDDAREKAIIVAKKMNKTIGEITAIVDNNTDEQYVQNYGTSTLQSHAVTVSFELK